MKTLRLGRYQHYKGNFYEILGIARHSETLEELVVYKALYPSRSTLWVRPKGMFLEKVKIGSKWVNRFRLIKDNPKRRISC